MRRDITRIAIVTAILFGAFLGLLLIVTRDGTGQGDVQGTGKHYRLTHAVVDGSLGTDGALTVSERITFEFHGNFSGAFRDIPLPDNQTFEEIGVREGATDYDSGASTELGGFGLPDTFGAVATFDESGRRVARIVWHFTAADRRGRSRSTTASAVSPGCTTTRSTCSGRCGATAGRGRSTSSTRR